MGRIIFPERAFSFEQLKERIPETMETDFAPAMQFCYEWLNGKEVFRLSTSGSTGLPKPIELTREQMEYSAQGTAEALGLSKGDNALVCLNTAYIAGTMMLVRGMVMDMNLLMVAPSSSPLRGIKDDFKIDFAAFVPLQLQTLLEEKDPQDLRILNQMKAIIVGGASINGALEDKIQTLSAPVFSTYGMTETVSHIALRRLNGKTKQEFYKTLPRVSIKTDDRDCLSILSPVTGNQWLQTNDVVELTGTDSFRWLGRADHTINSGGIKIQPEKTEKQLEKILSENGIQSFFIAGLPHPQLGEAVTLFIEGKETMKDQLLEKIRPMTDRYALPKAVIWMPLFPKTATGKTERSTVVAQFKSFYL